ncbi:acyl-CoA synthetase [Halorubellus salinus]|uniref:acyl-CoA synthetase n=1 Tax=Halorubellus salinus TaxID=755309 RepID=UPI001D0972B6|nr:AMP-binding protein [Halorubellus salinus]
MSKPPRLDAYHFYEETFDDYEQLREAFEWEVPERFNVADYVCDRWAAPGEERIALYAEDATGATRTITFDALRSTTDRLAGYLDEQGVERGDRVGIVSPQRPETVIAHIAIWKVGAVSVPLSTKFGPDAIRYRLRDCEAVACLVDEAGIDAFRDVRDDLERMTAVVTIGDVDPAADELSLETAIDGRVDDHDTVPTRAEDDAVIIYTSGTTGDPKGVRHAHRFFLGHLPLFVTDMLNLSLRDDDVFWMPSEWAWIATFDIIFPPLFYGKPAVAYNGGRFDPAKAFELVDRYDITVSFVPPTALRMMKEVDAPADRFDLSSMRTIASGGEALDVSTYEWARETFGDVAVHEGYGQTEANMLVANCTALFEARAGKMGRVGPGHEVVIVDAETAEPTVPVGEVGEIAVRYEGDPVCFKEYWNKPEKTAEKVQNGYVLTEDLGFVDEDGYFEFVSRKDYVIISAGYRIGPDEIEESLVEHAAVADAGVIGIPDVERGEVPKAFVKLSAGHEPSDDLATSLKAFVKERLAKYEYPREIEFVDALPTTSTGKVARRELEEREAPAPESTGEEPGVDDSAGDEEGAR